MGWRLAKSLETLRKQINSFYPKRSKASDGTIGDQKHSKRVSQHNPNAAGVVCAFDITHDPVNGVDCHKLAKALVDSKDARIRYLIWNGRITSDAKAGAWKRYTGSNPHNHHLHLSVNSLPKHYDDASDWKLSIFKNQPHTDNKSGIAISTPPISPPKKSVEPAAADLKQEADSPPLDDSSERSSESREAINSAPQNEAPESIEPVEVAQVKPEPEPEREVSGIKASVAGAITFITTTCAGVLSWLADAKWQIVATLAAVGVLFVIARFIFANNEKKRAHSERMERERQAFELQKLTLESAMRPDFQAVTIKPQPLQNSEVEVVPVEK